MAIQSTSPLEVKASFKPGRLGHHAIVIGGSVAGLISARVLSDYFECVTILERDEIEDRPVIHKSTPQGNHLHGLLNGGQRVLSALYPDFTNDLRGLGAHRVTIGRDIAWYLPDGKAFSATGSLRKPFDVGLEAHCASRGLIEYAIRRRTQQLPGIRLETGVTVGELICRDGRVLGVRSHKAESFEAELVVDAGGRASRASHWLAAVGVSAPPQTTIGVDTAYSTANIRVPDWYEGETLVFITGPAPSFTRRGYVIRIEDESLLVSLIGRFGDYPPTDREGFLAFAKELHTDLAWRILSDAEQFTPIAHHRFPISVRRHYERMTSFPEGLLVIGDALCTFNPIHAQGMSAAARQAKLLQQVLEDRASDGRGLAGIGCSFFSQAAVLNSTPWDLAAGFDFAFPQTHGERPADAAERAAYLAALDKLQIEDLEARKFMMEVMQLARPLSTLMEEPLRSRVLARM